MALFGKLFKKKEPQEQPAVPVSKDDKVEVVDIGERNVLVSTKANDGNVIAIIKSNYLRGKQPKAGMIEIPEHFASYVAVNGVFVNEDGKPIHGDVDIAKYAGEERSRVSVISYNVTPLNLATSVTIRVPGDELSGTIRFDSLLEGDGIVLGGLLDTSGSQEVIRDGVFSEKFLTAPCVKNIFEESVNDDCRRALNRNEVYNDAMDIAKEIADQINNDPFFTLRGLRIDMLYIRFEQTELEKIKDLKVRENFKMMEKGIKLDSLRSSVKMAKEEKEIMKDADDTSGKDDVI